MKILGDGTRGDNELLAAALNYAARGWRVLPCHAIDSATAECSCGKEDCGSAGKHPRVLRGCKDATREPPRIREWWADDPRGNVGIATGKESGIWVLDLDGPAGLAAFDDLVALHGAITDTRRVKTGRGEHLYFRYPSARPVGNRTKIGGHPIDARGDGGYVLAPPSLHRAGQRYAVLCDAEPAEAPRWLLDLVAPHASASKNGSAAHRAIVADVTERARAYLAACPPAISRQGGHAATFAVACALVQGFDLCAGEALPLLAEWNATCQPPWSDKELAHKLADAEKASPPPGKARGYLLVDRTPSFGTSNNTRPAQATPPQLIDVEPFQPFPLDALPEVARAFVAEGAAALGCDPAYLALPVLATLAGAVGNARTVRLKRSWNEPAILWAGIIGDSGTLKSPALDLALRPLHAIQAEHRAKYEDAVRGQMDAELEYKRALREWEKSKAKTKPPEKPAELICRRVLASDVTIERLARLLAENPRGLLVARDELAGWFAGLTRYRGGGASDAPHWLELHRAGTLLVDRVKDGGTTLIVRRAAVSLIGGIQPAVLARSLTAEHFDSGMAARFLLAMPPRRPKRWTEADISTSVVDGYSALLGRLIDLPTGIDGRGEPEPIALRLDDDAKDEWVRFYREWAVEQAELDGELAAAWSKLEGAAARLALIHHVASTADQGAAGPVGLESIRAGIVLAKWFAREARRIYGLLGESKEERELRRLRDWLAAQGGRATPRDLQRSSGRRHKTAEDAQAALEGLVRAGLAEWDAILPRPNSGFGFAAKLKPTADSSDSFGPEPEPGSRHVADTFAEGTKTPEAPGPSKAGSLKDLSTSAPIPEKERVGRVGRRVDVLEHLPAEGPNGNVSGTPLERIVL